MGFWEIGSERKTAAEVEEFWSATERELGERILVKSLGQYLGGFEGLKGPLWGIFFLTDSSLHFRHFRQENWYSLLLRASGHPGGDADSAFVIPEADVTEVLHHREASGGIFRLFSAPNPELVIRFRAENREERNLTIRLEQNRSEFLAFFGERRRPR